MPKKAKLNLVWFDSGFQISATLVHGQGRMRMERVWKNRAACHLAEEAGSTFLGSTMASSSPARPPLGGASHFPGQTSGHRATRCYSGHLLHPLQCPTKTTLFGGNCFFFSSGSLQDLAEAGFQQLEHGMQGGLLLFAVLHFCLLTWVVMIPGIF